MAFLEAIPVAAGVLKRLAPYAGKAALVAAGFALAVAYEHKAPWGPFPRLARAEAASAAWRGSSAAWALAARQERALAVSWARSKGETEAARTREQATATAAVGQLETACAARVAEALRSASAIQSIVSKEPAHDQKGCPVRELVDPGKLRDALLGPAAGPHAGG